MQSRKTKGVGAYPNETYTESFLCEVLISNHAIIFQPVYIVGIADAESNVYFIVLYPSIDTMINNKEIKIIIYKKLFIKHQSE